MLLYVFPKPERVELMEALEPSCGAGEEGAAVEGGEIAVLSIVPRLGSSARRALRSFMSSCVSRWMCASSRRTMRFSRRTLCSEDARLASSIVRPLWGRIGQPLPLYRLQKDCRDLRWLGSATPHALLASEPAFGA
jgi:hypothetical protein